MSKTGKCDPTKASFMICSTPGGIRVILGVGEIGDNKSPPSLIVEGVKVYYAEVSFKGEFVFCIHVLDKPCRMFLD